MFTTIKIVSMQERDKFLFLDVYRRDALLEALKYRVEELDRIIMEQGKGFFDNA
jgi:hypothetical protein